jgi:hypothetical protein
MLSYIAAEDLKLAELKDSLKNDKPISVGSPLDFSGKHQRQVTGDEKQKLIEQEIKETEERIKRYQDIQNKTLAIEHSLISSGDFSSEYEYKDRVQLAEEKVEKIKHLMDETKLKYEKKFQRMKDGNKRFALKIRNMDPEFLK